MLNSRPKSEMNISHQDLLKKYARVWEFSFNLFCVQFSFCGCHCQFIEKVLSGSWTLFCCEWWSSFTLDFQWCCFAVVQHVVFLKSSSLLLHILKHFRTHHLLKCLCLCEWSLFSLGNNVNDKFYHLACIQYKNKKRWCSWLSRYCKDSLATQILKVTELLYLTLRAKKSLNQYSFSKVNGKTW